MSEPGEITRLLRAWSGGDPAALDALLPLVYQELRQLAASYMRGESPGHTLSPTALVHESFLKLVQRDSPPDLHDRKHFFVVAARAMRRLLVDHARSKQAQKRRAPGAWEEDGIVQPIDMPGAPWSVIDLDRALDQLHKVDQRMSKALELRFFGGLTLDEIAEVLEVSPPTISRDLRMAEAWLAQEVRGSAAG